MSDPTTKKDAKKSEVEALTADRDYWMRKAKALEIAHDRLADEVKQRQDAQIRERPLRHWTPNELARRALEGLPVLGKRRHTAAEAIEELRVRALEAPHGR